MKRKNINGGFKKLRVWNDAVELYILTCKILSSFYKAGQIKPADYEKIDKLHYKMENGLLKLIKSLSKKMKKGSWNDKQGRDGIMEKWITGKMREPVAKLNLSSFHHSNIPSFQRSNQQPGRSK